MATDNILMECVKRGGDRQTLHEAIRRHSVAAGLAVKEEGKDNDLLDRIASDPIFGLSRADIDGIIKESNFCGMAKEQTVSFLETVRDVLSKNAGLLVTDSVASVNV